MKPAPGIRASKRVSLLPESAIKEMSRLANRYGAINLAQGSPDFSAPEPVKEVAIRAIRQGHNQYEISQGSVQLRKAIAKKLAEHNRITADWETEITVTCGSTEAVMDTVLALTGPGDEVIIPEPFYENYVPAAVVSGATPRYVRLHQPRFEFYEEDLKRKFNGRTKLIIVNTPNNPSGRVFTKKELGLVADLCEDYNALAISDEIYERIVYRGNRHLSLATLGNMSERTVTISGISKTFSVTGWRVGYAVAERRLSNAIRKIHDYMTVCAPAAFQVAAAAALALPASYYERLTQTYERKRSLTLRSLKEIGFRCVEPQGAYYVLAGFRDFSKEDDFHFCRSMVKKSRVALLPASSFYSNRGAGRALVRFSFCKKDDTIRTAMGRLKRTLN